MITNPISLLKDHIGIDKNLETSIFGYGFIWKLDEEKKEYHIVYGVEMDDAGVYKTFDWARVDADLDVYEEYSWAKFKEIHNYVGMTKRAWDGLPLMVKIYDLIGFYGVENIFGSSYDVFQIKE